MIRAYLLALLLVAGQAGAYSYAASDGDHESATPFSVGFGQPSGVEVCAAGDSITNNDGNPPTAPHDTVDWEGPIEAMGWNVWNLGYNGAYSYRGGTAGDDGEEILVETVGNGGDGTCDAANRTVDGSAQSPCIPDLGAALCDVWTVSYGTNDVTEGSYSVWDANIGSDEWTTAWTNILNEFEDASEDVLVVYPYQTYGTRRSKSELLGNAARTRFLTVLSAETYGGIGYLDLHAAYQSVTDTHGLAARFELFDNAAIGSTFDLDFWEDPANYDAGGACSGDCTHPETSVVSPTFNRTGADDMGIRIRNSLIALHGGTTVTTTAATISSGPAFPAEYSMDFEGSGCADSGSDTCTLTTGSPDADCTTGACPIAGTQSLLIPGSAGQTTDAVTMDIPDQTDDSGVFVLDFTFEKPAASVNASRYYAVNLRESALFELCQLRVRNSNNTLQVCVDQVCSADMSGFTFTDDTTYKARLRYTASTGVCDGWVTSDGGFGETGTDGGTATASDTPTGADAVDIYVADTFESNPGGIAFDDFEFCNSDPGAGNACGQ